LEEYPEDAGLQYRRGVTLALLGWGRECAKHLTEAYRIDGEYLAGFFQVANLMATRGRLEVAESIVSLPILKEAVRINELNYNLGIMYIAGGRPEKALPLLEGAARFEGDNIDLTLLIYRTARDAGAEDEMMSSLEKLVQIDRQLVKNRMPWVFRELGKLYESRGEYLKAERMYAHYIEAAPGDSAAVELKKGLKGRSPLN
jgi:tetratricopeptide (TPR) repeat protein